MTLTKLQKSWLFWIGFSVMLGTGGAMLNGKAGITAFGNALAAMGGAVLGAGLGVLALMLTVDLFTVAIAKRELRKSKPLGRTTSRDIDKLLSESVTVTDATVYVCRRCGTDLNNTSVSDKHLRVWDCPKCGAYWTWVHPPTLTR